MFQDEDAANLGCLAVELLGEFSESSRKTYSALPILDMFASHSAHFPRVAGRPFLRVTASVSCISRCVRHFMHYPFIKVSILLVGSVNIIGSSYPESRSGFRDRA